MRKGLFPSLSFSRRKMIPSFKKVVQTASLFLLFILLFTSYVSAQQKMSPEVARQIQSLMDEKASRTPAQKKMSSQLIYSYKMRNGQRITAEVASLQVDVEKDAEGRIKVELDAVVTTQLLNQLKALGCEIITSSEKYGSVLTAIPVDRLEEVAAMGAVKHLIHWTAPINNSERRATNTTNGNITNANADHSTNKYSPELNRRAEKLRKDFDRAFRQKALNGRFAFEGAVTSEADVTHKAALARAVFQTDGTGVKIGVLSNGVTGFQAAINSGDLPPFTILPGQAGTGSEGWAMMELIHDLAPGAELFYATANPTQAQFAQNILDLRAAGCDIIVDDVNYFAEGVFQDDNVAQAVNTVTASGALYFSSAGNSGNENDNTSGVWEGDFVDGGASAAPLPLTGTLHSYSGGTLYNILTFAGRVTLKWSDPLGQSGNDYDLFVTNSTGTALAASSTTVQDGNDNPYEDVGNRTAGQRIYILKKTGAAVTALHLNTNRGLLTFHTPGVVYGHNAAASAYTVAATPTSVPFGGTASTTGPYPNPFNAGNKVEGFSSDGPRRIFYNPDGSPITPGNILFSTNGGLVLQKPDITAGDGAVTTTPGFIPFFGTSAAAPHAAAIAALIKSKLPAATPAEIRAALIASAIDIETPGVDRDAGVGIIMAYEALQNAGATAVSAIGLGTVTAVEVTGNGNGVVEAGDRASMTIQLTNPSPATATNVTAVLSTSTPGINIIQNSSSYGDIATGSATNTASPYLFDVYPQVPCGTAINFTLTVTYGGGGTSPAVFNFTFKTGSTPGTITATLGSAPPAGVGYTATSGIQTNRLNRTGVIPSCGTPKATPVLQEAAPGTLKAYHAYTFTNTSTISQCVTVSITSTAVTSIYQVVYGNGGYNPAAIQANFLADQGTTTNAAPFSFTAPPGQQFTVVVHEVATNGGLGVTYNLNVNMQSCAAPPVVINAAAPVVITAENAVPANNTPDPGETLTLNLPLINNGTGSTSNLVATLLPTGGVTNPSSPQNYGVVVASGPSVAMPYNFTAAGNCGDNITLTLALQDGATNLGTISYTLKLGTSVIDAPVTFANTTPVIIPGTGTGATGGVPANPYPSTINVSGLTGTTNKITVGLKQFNHTFPDDVGVLLVSPTGQKMILMSEAGDNPDAVNIDLVLDDAAATTLPATTALASGTFRPTNITSGADVYVSPAPAGPYLSPAPAGTATLASAFNGQNPNGTWSLYVIDNFTGDAGNFNGGWDITITTATPVCSVVPDATTSIALVASSNASCLGSSVTFTATLSRVSVPTGPVAGATVTFTVTLPDASTLTGTSVTDINGLATYTPPILPVGVSSVTASYAGAPGILPGNSNVLGHTVNPIPAGVATPSSQAICSGATITTIELSSAVSGTTYNWTRDNTGSVTGIAAAGSGDISGVLTHTTNPTVTVTFTITPIAEGCAGDPFYATVTIGDEVGPITPVLSTVTAECSVTLPAPTALDNCAGAVTGTTTTVFPVTAQGTTIVTWSFDDGHGNISTTTQTVEIHDVTAPLAPATLATVTSDCSVSVGPPTAPDNCAGNILGTTNTVFPITAEGTTTITWTFNDGHGNTSTATQTVIIDDVTPPTAPTSLPTLTADCSVTPVAPVAQDGCVGPVTGTTTTAFPITTPGTTTVTWTFNDGRGNSSTATQTVIIAGPLPPSVTCPANINETTSAGVCGKSIVVPNPVITIRCGTITSVTWLMTGATTGSSPATGTNYVGTKTFNTGTTTIAYTVKDAAGNQVTCSFTVTVTDGMAPVLTCPANITQAVSGNVCNRQITVTNPTVTDNCAVASLTWIMTGATTGSSVATGTNYVGTKTFNVGTTTITYTAKDAAGNTSTCSFTVKVTESVLPTITCPGNRTINSDYGLCGFNSINLTTPTVNDNCGIASLTHNAPAILPIGATTVTWTVTDKSGNTRTCSQVLTVVDAQNPEVTSPANITANTNAGNCSASITTPNPTYFDNCAVVRLTWVMTGATTGSSPSTGFNNVGTKTFNKGLTTITYTVRDAAGRTGSSSFAVTVTDNERPSLSCPGNIAQTASNSSCGRSIAVTNPTYADNCGVTKLTWFMTGATQLSSSMNGVNLVGTKTFNVGVTTVTYSIWDAAGNTRSCTFTVTVTDAQPPVVTCPASRTLCKKANNSYSIPSVVVSDNCGIASTVYAITGATTRSGTGLNVSGTFNLGVSTIKWTVTDFNGLVTTCTTTVTIAPAGNCNNVRTTAPEDDMSVKSGKISIEKMEVSAYPNPSGTYFNIRVSSNSKGTVAIRMLDMLGKVVEVNRGAPDQTFKFGEHVVSGMYMIEVKQGGETALVKVLKN